MSMIYIKPKNRYGLGIKYGVNGKILFEIPKLR